MLGVENQRLADGGACTGGLGFVHREPKPLKEIEGHRESENREKVRNLMIHGVGGGKFSVWGMRCGSNRVWFFLKRNFFFEEQLRYMYDMMYSKQAQD